jgi:ergothioneine biosynthesis protein EgtB
MRSIPDMKLLAERFATVWARTDRLLETIAPDAVLARPIALRHPFIFYVGHLPAFAWNHIGRGALKRPSFSPRFDEIFERGIDPDVDDPRQCHAHPPAPEQWPDLREVADYRDRVRDAILESLTAIDTASANVMTQKGRVLSMAIEHELMHQETLLYMVHQLPPEQKVRPKEMPPFCFGDGLRPRAAAVGEGVATLGASFTTLDFGWDNEFPQRAIAVPAFTIDSTPVTNSQFCDFVESGAYERPEFWSDGDWAWKRRAGLTHPLVWAKQSGVWFYRTMFDFLPLDLVGDWPVYASLAEAQAYARWSGARLPTEAEFHRAAYGDPDGRERSFPWGEDLPGPHHGNFGFTDWAPRPVGSRPEGVSAWGVHELVGNGWEWTETAFAPLPGFHAYIPGYPGYSADFFDGKHYVLKGASWATDAQLVRRSFRNWYQARYPYVFAKFRCVREMDD